jgi:hypothetical protein
MAREALLARARIFDETGMSDACTIRRRTGETTDPSTGVVTPTYLSPDPYAGKCRIQQRPGPSRPHEVSEDFVLIGRLEVQLPMAVTGLKVADEITVTVSTHDPDLVGRVFLIHGLAHKTDGSSRRVAVTERMGF